MTVNTIGSAKTPTSKAGSASAADKNSAAKTAVASTTGKITSTSGHRYWDATTQAWTEAGQIKTGDILQEPDGITATVTATTSWTTETATPITYNLTIGELHTYYVVAGAFPLLVHNASCKVVSENQGGRFGDLSPGTPGDGLTAHHMPQDALRFLPRNDGGSVVMKEADHALTRTFSNAGKVTKAAETGLPFRTVLARDLWDLRSVGQQQYGDPSYYDAGIKQMMAYYRSIGMI